MSPKHILMERLEELRGALRSRDGLAIEAVAEEAELTRNIADRDIEAMRMNSCSNAVKEILDAMDRVDSGEYGVCIECEEAISAKRLAALPWAKRCIACQERFDSSGAIDEIEYDTALAA